MKFAVRVLCFLHGLPRLLISSFSSSILWKLCWLHTHNVPQPSSVLRTLMVMDWRADQLSDDGLASLPISCNISLKVVTILCCKQMCPMHALSHGVS